MRRVSGETSGFEGRISRHPEREIRENEPKYRKSLLDQPCVPKLSKAAFVLLVGGIFGGEVKIVDRILGQEAKSKEVFVPEKSQTLEEEKDLGTELDYADQIFSDAAERLKTKASISTELSPEKFIIAEEVMKSFSVTTTIDTLSELSGLSSTDLVVASQFHNIQLITTEDYQRQDLGILDQKSRREVNELRYHLGINIDGYIGINLTRIAGFEEWDDEREREIYKEVPDAVFEAELESVIQHELVHSWGSAINKRGGENYFMEGMTEALAGRIESINHSNIPLSPTAYEAQEKYVGGQLQFAELLLASTEPKALTRAFLQGDWQEINNLFDIRYGKGSLERICQPPLDQGFDRNSFYYVAKLLETIGSEAVPSVIAEANKHIKIDKIGVRYQGGDLIAITSGLGADPSPQMIKKDGKWMQTGYRL